MACRVASTNSLFDVVSCSALVYHTPQGSANGPSGMRLLWCRAQSLTQPCDKFIKGDGVHHECFDLVAELCFLAIDKISIDLEKNCTCCQCCAFIAIKESMGKRDAFNKDSRLCCKICALIRNRGTDTPAFTHGKEVPPAVRRTSLSRSYRYSRRRDGAAGNSVHECPGSSPAPS